MEIYVTLSTPRVIACQREWHRVWYGKLDLYSQLLAVPLKLRVTLHYQGETNSRLAYFSSVVFHNDRMSVGEYAGGDAGNGWGAPFTDRREAHIVESNCRSFYYNETQPCSANGVMPYEDQLALNYTTIERGYYWGSENETLANTTVKYITLHITPINP